MSNYPTCHDCGQHLIDGSILVGGEPVCTACFQRRLSGKPDVPLRCYQQELRIAQDTVIAAVICAGLVAATIVTICLVLV